MPKPPIIVSGDIICVLELGILWQRDCNDVGVG